MAVVPVLLFFRANDFFLLQPMTSSCTHNTFQSWFPLETALLHFLFKQPTGFLPFLFNGGLGKHFSHTRNIDRKITNITEYIYSMLI